eukprot:scaffold668833_cov98-Prasinocladus_malaysianus.AAC.1
MCHFQAAPERPPPIVSTKAAPNAAPVAEVPQKTSPRVSKRVSDSALDAPALGKVHSQENSVCLCDTPETVLLEQLRLQLKESKPGKKKETEITASSRVTQGFKTTDDIKPQRPSLESSKQSFSFKGVPK